MINTCTGMSVAQVINKAYRSVPDKEALYDGTRHMSYRELYDQAEEIAAGLKQLGVKQGDRIAVCLPVWYEFIVILFAAAKIGAILVPFNTRYREEEAEYILRDSGAKVVFFPKTYDEVDQLAQFLSLRQRLDGLEHLIPVRFQHDEMQSYNELRQSGQNAKQADAKIEVKTDIFAIVYTSGTTGKPKGAMLTHSNVVDLTTAYCTSIRGNDSDVFLHLSPFFHIMGIISILRFVICEAKVVILESFKAQRVLELIEQEKVTVHPGVPTMFILELNHPDFKKYDLSSLRLAITASAPCPVEVVRRIKMEMGCIVLVSYGLTETSSSLTITDFEDDEVIQTETVGRAMSCVELKAVDDEGSEVAVGEVGELVCRSIGLMKGYYHLPEKTREAFHHDGWFCTGDLVTIDARGYVRIVGRKKDIIIRGGYNIYPIEIEDLYYKHPAILEASIVGLPDTVLGEVSCAAVLLKPEIYATPEDLKSYIREKVADYKRPDHIVIVDQLPKTASGKVVKQALRDHIIQHKLVALR